MVTSWGIPHLIIKFNVHNLTLKALPRTNNHGFRVHSKSMERLVILNRPFSINILGKHYVLFEWLFRDEPTRFLQQ